MSGGGKLCNSEKNHLHSEVKHLKGTLNKNILHSLNFEKERIKTFLSWPIHYPVDPARLAKSGFYYSGCEDEVICFSCHGCVKNWNYGDIVQKKHAELFPDCEFINGGSNNVPLSKNSDLDSSDLKVIGKLNETKESRVSSMINYSQMKIESERLQTFNGKWPLSFIDINELSHAGFFYLGYDDKVQCPYCKVIVSCWEPGDKPLTEHEKHFPTCEYLTDSKCEKSKNISSWFKAPSSDACGNMEKNTYDSESLKYKLLDKSQQHVNLEKLGVHLHKRPAHPQQASLTARLRSFYSWPLSAPVSKEDLAKAGFFHIGISDHTKCFHCNGGLCNWEDGDDPWVEHARWFFNCDFLHLTKGSAFIESCLQKFSPVRTMDTINEKMSALKCSEPLMHKVDEAMNSIFVKYVLETGLFPPYIVRAAILRQIYETGCTFPNVDELCLAVSCLKEEMEKESFKIDDIKSSDLNICEITYEKPAVCEDSHLSTLKNDAEVQSLPLGAETESKGKVLNGTSQNLAETSEEESSFKDQCLCKICMDKEVGVVFLPCGHLLSCTTCAPALKFCPMCRKTIQATVRAYLN